MTIQSEFAAKHPDSIIMEMRVSMTLGEWARIREALVGQPRYECRDFAQHITSLITQGRETFYPKLELESQE